MWKALLFVFVITPDAPLASIVMQFPVAFAREADCRTFLASKSSEPEAVIAGVLKKQGIEVIGISSDCVRSTAGTGI